MATHGFNDGHHWLSNGLSHVWCHAIICHAMYLSIGVWETNQSHLNRNTWGDNIIKLGELGSQRIDTSGYPEQHSHDFSFLVDQGWIYNLWFTTEFLGQIWWKRDLWVMFSNAKSMTCNLEMKSISATRKIHLIDKLSYKIIYLSNDIFVNCIQKALR